MPVTRVLRGRGVNGVLVVAAEPMFAPTGDVGRWTNTLSNRVRRATAQAAPTNKRPRWAHYGKPLKQTFTARTEYDPERLRVYAGIGSSAPHALYVDQGTSPFLAKILPPWTHGGSDLREASYKYPESNGLGRSAAWVRTGGIPVKGQRAQRFFDAGLSAGLASMGVRTVEMPVDAGIQGIIDGAPASLTGASGNTPATGAFIAQLEEWRAWRREGWEAFQKSRPPRKRASRSQGRNRRATQEDRRRWWREASQRYRDRNREPGKPKAQVAGKGQRAAFVAFVKKKYGSGNVESNTFRVDAQGRFYITVRVKDDQGRNVFREIGPFKPRGG